MKLLGQLKLVAAICICLLLMSGCASNQIISDSLQYKSSSKVKSLDILPLAVKKTSDPVYFAELKTGWDIQKAANRVKIPARIIAIENTNGKLEVSKPLAQEPSSHLVTIEILNGTVLTSKDSAAKDNGFMSEYEARIILLEVAVNHEIWRGTVKVKLGLGSQETIGDKIINKMRENGLLAEAI